MFCIFLCELYSVSIVATHVGMKITRNGLTHFHQWVTAYLATKHGPGRAVALYWPYGR